MQRLKTGTLLQEGKYKIENSLGQGSFGITYLAEHTNLGKKVAIKEFFMKELNSRGEDGSITGMSDGSLSQNYCQKFRKEAINMCHLDHPNIVRVTDSFSENGTFYYVMDFIDGQNLNDYIKQHHVSESEAVKIIKSVADALVYMHEKHHMLHLDLKPGNIMRRNSDGHIFLIDFGLSKHYSNNGQPETSTTIGLGTTGYAPVEQSNQSKNGEFRPTIDVYALGATLYKLVTSETPPSAAELVSDEELLTNKLTEHNITGKIANVITNAMRPNVRKRIQTISDFVNLLENIDASQGCQEDTIIDNDSNKVDFSTAMTFYNKGQYEKAFPLLEQLANSGNIDAMFRLGVCYYWNEGIVPSNPISINLSKCADWMLKAANFGNSDAMLWLGRYIYANGEGVEQDQNKSVEYAKKSANVGNYSAMIFCGLGEENTESERQLLSAGFSGLLKKSSLLSREEMWWLAICYDNGWGTKEDSHKAVYWYEQSANLGDPESQNMLGNIYLNGWNGVAENESKAFCLFKLSANKNYADALKNVADCYCYGWGTIQNYTKAVEWYNKAIEAGSDEAIVSFGICYRNGYGVTKDYKKAENLFLRAINETGNSEALNYLGLIYEEGGFGITKDLEKSIKYFEKAALQDLPVAQYNYGLSLLNGDGITADVDKGMEWINKAAGSNCQEAIDFLDSLNKESESSPVITSTPTDGHGFFVNNEYVNTKHTSVHLNMVNGIGTTLKGHYREAEGTYVAYEFFCLFFLPLIPMGCYRVKDAEGDSYLVYGSTEWHLGEVLWEYLKWWGGGIILIFVIGWLKGWQ